MRMMLDLVVYLCMVAGLSVFVLFREEKAPSVEEVALGGTYVVVSCRGIGVVSRSSRPRSGQTVIEATVLCSLRLEDRKPVVVLTSVSKRNFCVPRGHQATPTPSIASEDNVMFPSKRSTRHQDSA